MKKLIVILSFFAAIVMNNAMAITISLVPSQEKIHPGDNIFITINISGLHETLPSGNQVNSLLGAFSSDFLYDPSLLTFLGTPPAGWGTYLGNPGAGEAVGDIDRSVPGVISLALVSLLSDSELASLQDNLNSFTLATLGFYAPIGGIPDMPKWPPNWPSGSTVFDTTNVILGDELGNRIPLLDAAGNPILDADGNPVPAPIATPGLIVAVPEPKTLFLFVFGLLLMPLAGLSNRQKIIDSIYHIVGLSFTHLNRKSNYIFCRLDGKTSILNFISICFLSLLFLLSLSLLPLKALASTPSNNTIVHLIGDRDGFHAGDLADIPPQSQHVQQILAFLASDPGQNPAVNLDVGGVNRPVGLTHSIALPPNARITSAIITFRIRGDELVYNDGIFYDQTILPTTRSLPLPVIILRDLLGREPQAGETLELEIKLSKVPVRTVDTTGGPGGHWSPNPDEFRNLLPLLSDGEFDLVFSDDVIVDFSELKVTYVMPSTQSGDLTGDGIVDRRDLDVIMLALNTSAYPGDPRDLNNDGKINVLDARKLVLKCTQPHCDIPVIEATRNWDIQTLGKWTDPKWFFNPATPGVIFPNNNAHIFDVTDITSNEVILDLDQDIAVRNLVTADNNNKLKVLEGHALTAEAGVQNRGTIEIIGNGSRFNAGDFFRNCCEAGNLLISEGGSLKVGGQFGNTGYVHVSGLGSFIQMNSYQGSADIANFEISGGATATIINAFNTLHGDGGVVIKNQGSMLTANTYEQKSSQFTTVEDYGLLQVFADYNQNYARTTISDSGMVEIKGAYKLINSALTYYPEPLLGSITEVLSNGYLAANEIYIEPVCQLFINGGYVWIEHNGINRLGNITVTGQGSTLNLGGNYKQEGGTIENSTNPPRPNTEISDGATMDVAGQINNEAAPWSSFFTVKGNDSSVVTSSYFGGEDSGISIFGGANFTTSGDFIASGDAGVYISDAGSLLSVGGKYSASPSGFSTIKNGAIVNASNFDAHGSVRISTNGLVKVNGVFNIFGGGDTVLENSGTLTAKELIVTMQGQLMIDGGSAVKIGGDIDNTIAMPGKLTVETNGRLAASGDRNSTPTTGITGDVNLDGGIIEPGDPESPDLWRTMFIDGNFNVNKGKLVIEVAGLNPPDILYPGQFDIVELTGSASFSGGEIHFAFTNGFIPKPGDQFQFLKATKGVAAFNNVLLSVQGVPPGFRFQVNVVADGLLFKAI